MNFEEAVCDVMAHYQIDTEDAQTALAGYTQHGCSPLVAKHLVLEDYRSALLAYIDEQDDPGFSAFSALFSQLDWGQAAPARTEP